MKNLAFLLFIISLFVTKITTAGNVISEPDSLQTKSQSNSQSDSKTITGEWILFEHDSDTLDKNNEQNSTLDSININQIVTEDKVSADKLKKRKKIIATLLAFPLPCGIIGLHRVYLGTKPYVPLVYIATFGGAVGIVPFIDFIVLLLEKDISKYENNPNIIMWAN
ncbi:MAG: TM2 domain-containing protein [Bacteroidetes bacterium]|nr:TM2 domain-containing protein [Bacteroidota bacterium]